AAGGSAAGGGCSSAGSSCSSAGGAAAGSSGGGSPTSRRRFGGASSTALSHIIFRDSVFRCVAFMHGISMAHAVLTRPFSEDELWCRDAASAGASSPEDGDASPADEERGEWPAACASARLACEAPQAADEGWHEVRPPTPTAGGLLFE